MPVSAMTAGQCNVKPKSHRSDAGYAPISSSTIHLGKGKVPSLMMTPGMMGTVGTDERLAMKPYPRRCLPSHTPHRTIPRWATSELRMIPFPPTPLPGAFIALFALRTMDDNRELVGHVSKKGFHRRQWRLLSRSQHPAPPDTSEVFPFEACIILVPANFRTYANPPPVTLRSM